MDDPLTITENAAIIGYGFAKDYYTVLRRQPKCVDEFYDDIGEYKTVFEDGTIVLARTRQEAKKVLLGPIYEPRLIVNSIITVPCGGSLNRMMITVSGRSFTTVFIAELRPERPLTYVIVSSMTRHFSAGPDADRQILEMRFAAGDGPAYTGVDRMAMDGLKPK
ncbi:NTF2-like domain, partial [Cinara cedri]